LDSAKCSDGLVCNGVETCHPTQGCIKAPPASCDDKDPCSIDRCDEDAKACVHDIRDFDRDGEADYHCTGGTDCDDFDATRGMLSRELCGDGVDNDCDESVDEMGCGAVPHDTCDDALDISAGGVFNVSTVGAVGDYALTCGEAMAARDLAFKLRLDEPKDLELIANGLRPDGSGDIAVVAIQTACGDLGSELQCAQGFPGDLRVRALPAGEYYVLVSAAIGASSVLLKVDFSEPTSAPTNTACETALDVGRGGHFDGDFIDVDDTLQTSCSVLKQPDLYYKLTLTEVSDVEISAIGSESQPLTVALRHGCGEAAKEERCQTAQRILYYFHQLPAGSYVIVVDGPVGREIDFGMDVAVMPPTPPPPGDSCLDPQPLKLDEPQKISLIGMQDDTASRCQGRGAPDVVFSLTLDEPHDLSLRVAADDESQVTVALQSECGNDLSERVCRPGMPLESVVHALPAGKYFLVMDSFSANTLEVTAKLAPPTAVTAATANDTCYSAVKIPDTGGIFAGDTTLMQPDYRVTCRKMSGYAKDAAFSLDLLTGKRVVVRVDASFDAVLMRYRAPDSGDMLCTGDALACEDDSDQHIPILDERLPPGRYYYIVTGYSIMDAGTYQLDVSLSDS
jgi:hypothetical protein